LGTDDPDQIAELLAAFGAVSIRRMFGGAGIFAEGRMLGLVVDGEIFLKADRETMPAFEREGMRPFSYRTKQGTRSLGSYWRMPERLYDNPEELAEWARRALDAAHRAGARSTRGLTASSQGRKKR